MRDSHTHAPILTRARSARPRVTQMQITPQRVGRFAKKRYQREAHNALYRSIASFHRDQREKHPKTAPTSGGSVLGQGREL